MSDDSKAFMNWVDVLAKGILAGGSIGVIAGLLGLLPIGKAVALGGLAGCLASIRFKQRRDERRQQGKK